MPRNLIYFFNKELKKNDKYKILKTILNNQELFISAYDENQEMFFWSIDYKKYLKMCEDIIQIEAESMNKAKIKYDKYLEKYKKENDI